MSTFTQDLDLLERITMQQGYNYAVTDLEKILSEAVDAATTPEEMALILKIQTAIYAMSEVRFPSKEREN